MDLEDIVGWVGCFITTCFYIPQLFPFIKILQKKIYFEDAPGFFISSCYANCFLWVIYGDMIFSDQLRITNMIACGICLIAMIIYLFFEIKKYILDTILNILILIMASWVVYRYLTIAIEDDRIIGMLCIFSSFIIYSYFSFIISRVIKERNYMLINLTNTIIYFASCIIWLSYGLISKDIYIIFPYLIGIIISLIQIVIYLNYERKFPIIGEKDLISTIGIESSGNKKEETEIKIGEDISKSKEKPVKIVSKIDN